MYNRGGDRMKIYDTHSDIMFNLYNRTMNGEKDVFAKYHLDDLKKGGIAGGIWVIYSETDFDIQPMIVLYMLLSHMKKNLMFYMG